MPAPTDQLEGRPPLVNIFFWLAQLAIVIAGAAFLGPRIASPVLVSVLAVLLLLVLAVLLWGLLGALRTRVIISQDTVLIRRAFTSDGVLLADIRDVREASSNHWIITLADASTVIVPMDITNHARIGVALLEAAAANTTQCR